MSDVVLQAVGVAPFAWSGVSLRRRVVWVLACLTLLASLYAALYDATFLARFLGYTVLGLGFEVAYELLASGRLGVRSGSSAVTAALLVCSVPPTMPVGAMVLALGLAVVVARMPSAGAALRLNPMLVGRLFLMLAFNDAIVAWPSPPGAADALATATPLELFHTEEAVYPLGFLARGLVFGEWESLYRLVPGSPGEAFTPVILLMGVLLCGRRVMEWRVGVAFLLAFSATHAVIGQPVLFNLLSGSAVFAAVFIAGDPGSTPRSRLGRWVGGSVAGVANALIRTYTVYSEGIVYSFLLLNLISPSLDRMAFALRGWRLIARHRRFTRACAEGRAP